MPEDCIYCSDRPSEFKINMCGHYLCCFECASALVHNRSLPNICPLCRGRVGMIYGKCKGLCKGEHPVILKNGKYPECEYCEQNLSYRSMQLTVMIKKQQCLDRKEITCGCVYKYAKICDNEAFEHIYKYIEKSKTSREWKNRLKSILDDMKFFKVNKNHTRTMFSYEQMVKIGTSMTRFTVEDYRLYNGLVRLCIHPWKLSRLFSHGICYFGNYGETPDNAAHAIKLISRNFIDPMNLQGDKEDIDCFDDLLTISA